MTTPFRQILALLATQPGGFFHRQLLAVSTLDSTLHRMAYGPIS